MWTASLGYVSVGTMVAWSCNAFAKLHLGNLGDPLKEQPVALVEGEEVSVY